MIPRQACLLLGVAAGTVAAAVLVQGDFLRLLGVAMSEPGHALFLQLLGLYLPFYLLLYGSITFQLAYYGEYKVRRRHRPAPDREIDAIFDREEQPELLVLVPSYKEEATVIHQTLLSAALLVYPRRRIVLLIDDLPTPPTPQDKAMLERARSLPRELQELFTPLERRYRAVCDEYLKLRRCGTIDRGESCRRLANHYEEVARFFDQQVAAWLDGRSDDALEHTERLLIDRFLRVRSQMYRDHASALRRGDFSFGDIDRDYRKLAALFAVRIGSFERKRYVNLSHAPNKAMNLNTYLGLMGGWWREVVRPDGLHLEPAAPGRGGFEVPGADYVLTLDADSMVTHDYAQRLIHIMEQPGNERVAVAQCPYSAIPGTPVLLERLAGATTDIQCVAHHGVEYFNATSWVGANAILRRAALDDIMVEAGERGYPIKVFIQDKTVVEDTGSTIELIIKNWRLVTYPERLAYSATPSDFGSLLVQRQRWANGGLIILPRLFHYLCQQPLSRGRICEFFIRANYLLSSTLGSIAAICLLICTFDDRMMSIWLPVGFFPYLVLYSSVLLKAGYRWIDLPRVYALNAMLFPIILGGTIQSIRQIITGQKVRFARTPKITGRTAIPFSYIVVYYVIMVFYIYLFVDDAMAGRHFRMIFTSLNSLTFIYGMARFVGLRNSFQDLRAYVAMWTRREPAAAAPAKRAPDAPALAAEGRSVL